MELFLRICRALIIGLICYGCLKYLDVGNEAIFIAIGVTAFGILTFFFRWSVVFTGGVIVWAAVHLLFKVPGPEGIANYLFETPVSVSPAAPTFNVTLTTRLSDIEKAKKENLISEAEYQMLRKDTIDDELKK